MKTLGQAAFFRVFDRVVRPQATIDETPAWTVDGVDWRRQRVTQRGAGPGFAVEIFVGEKPGRNGWTLMVVRESWWDGEKADPVKDRQWSHLVRGRKSDALAWFQTQEPRA
jgi:hypothetical protein